MFEKQGVLILAKEMNPGQGWWTYYLPFSSFGRFLDQKGPSIQIGESADWINAHYEVDPAQLENLRQQIERKGVPTFNGFEVAPRLV
jgi:hypothetical protein